MSAVFFDTNILVYAFTSTDDRRVEASRLMQRGGAIGVQCLNEFASVAGRKMNMDAAAVDEAIDLILSVCGTVVPLTLDLHRHGLVLSRRHRLSVYDGMIVAAALSAGCSVLYSEDMHAGLVVEDRLTITNPF